jgi:hypothetical protein
MSSTRIFLRAAIASVFCLTAMLCSAAAQAQESTAPPTADGPSAGEIDFERLPNGDIRLGLVLLQRDPRALLFPATINMNVGPLEVLIATPVGRLHESLLRSEVNPLHLQTMLILLGLENGPRLNSADHPRGDLVDIFVEWTTDTGEIRREPVENWIIDNRTGEPMAQAGWVFVGSSVANGEFLAATAGNLALLFSVGDTVLDNPDPEAEDDTLYEANPAKQTPPRKTPVTVILMPRPSAEKQSENNIHDAASEN